MASAHPVTFGLRNGRNQAECTRLFYENNMLDYHQALTDGFYDCGRSVPSLPSLEALKNQPPHAGREVILLDAREDMELRCTVEKIHNTLKHIPDLRAKVHALSLLVSNYYGGSNVELIPNTERGILDLKQKLWTNVLPIGKLQFGVCRHRAVVFKYIADQLKIPCRLIRGDYLSEKGTEGHAWNIVYLDGKHMLCDIMHEPGYLYEESSEKAEHYKRIAKQEGGLLRYAGGAGMQSLPIPLNLKQSPVTSDATEVKLLQQQIETLKQQLVLAKDENTIKDIQLERLGMKLLELNNTTPFW